MKDAALGLLLDALDRLPVGHLLAFDLLDDLAADLLAQLAPLLRVARVGQQRGDQRRPASRQRPPRRPDVQRRDVPMPDILLVDGVQRRLLEREGVFDQSGEVVHALIPATEGTEFTEKCV